MTATFDNLLSVSAILEKFAKQGIHVSERALREKARARGCYRQIGGALFFTPADLERLMEPDLCQPKTTASGKQRKARTGSIGSRKKGVGLKEAQERLAEVRRDQRAQG